MKSFLENLLNLFARVFLKTNLADLKQKYRDDPTLSRMVLRFNGLHEKIFLPNFNHVQVREDDLLRLKELAQKGTLVFVMKTKGQLEYSFLNHRFLKEGIPLVELAPGLRTLFWRPFKEMFGLILGKLGALSEKKNQNGEIIEEKIANGQNVLLHLKPSRAFFFGEEEKPAPFLPHLIKSAKANLRPVFVIPVDYLHKRHPDKEEKTWFDLWFGEKSNPGKFRKFILFLSNYRKPASVNFGEALDLKTWMDEEGFAHDENVEASVSALQSILLNRLSIERKAITGPTLKPSSHFLSKMLSDVSFQEEVKKISVLQNKTEEEILSVARSIFKEMVADINYTFIDFYDQMIRFITTHVFEGVEVNQKSLDEIKTVAGKHPVVLVSSHRSHIDYLLLSYIFYNNNLTLPHICAGINLKFWPADFFIRRGGGFFIRRKFGGDALYKLVLGHYVKNLVAEGFTTEFFIEGTRSRTGKMLLPKTGFLSLVADTFWEKKTEDICFVPVNIHYEQVLEANAYAEEMLGAEKKKEKASDFLSVFKFFRKKYGKVYVNFGKPVMMKEFVEKTHLSPLPSPLPQGERRKEDERKIINDLSLHLASEINAVTVVTATSLVALVLLSHKNKSLSHDEMMKHCLLLRKYLKKQNVPLSGVLNHEGTWPFEEAISRLLGQKLVAEHSDFHGLFYTIDEKKRLLLDYYKNNSLHYFVSLSAFAKANGDELKYKQLITLLSREFVLIPEKTNAGFVAALEFCREEGMIDMWGLFLDSFLESLYVVLLYCKHRRFEKIQLSVFEKQIVEEGLSFYKRGTFFFTEALSFHTVKQMILYLLDKEVLKKDGSMISLDKSEKRDELISLVEYFITTRF